MLCTAATPTADAFSLSPSLWPTVLTFDNFVRVVSSTTNPFVQQFLNTVLVSLAATALAMIFGLSGAYALARLSFRGRGTLGTGIILLQFFPGVLLVIPLFVVLSRLGLTNSLVGLAIAYTTLTLPFTIWILRGYLQSLPVEIEDAARVDGCSYIGVIVRIVIPTIAPALAVVATLAFVSSWNEYLLALVLVNKPGMQLLGVGLTSFASQYGTDFPGLFAMATLTTIPVVLVFLVFQRSLVGGLSAGAIK
jgi:ABC-type glycerol-3-phosphate transport system permease component